MMEEPLRPDDAPMTRKAGKRHVSIAVMVLMGLDIFLGLGIAAAGYYLLQSLEIAVAGAGLATLGAVIMLAHQFWGDGQ